MTVLLVALGAVVGAPLRYHADRLLQGRRGAVFPLGTLAVNVVGSFVLGAVAAGTGAGVLDGRWQALLGTGFCGALTTYSTFGYETVRLVEDGAHRYALLSTAANLTLGLGAAALGWWSGQALWG